jgi:hypothetical protein
MAWDSFFSIKDIQYPASTSGDVHSQLLQKKIEKTKERKAIVLYID